jgi:5-methylcytosine-specific restriction protein A
MNTNEQNKRKGLKFNKNTTYHERYSEFYNSKEWKALRNYKWGMANGLCEHCLKKGIVRQAREVHHIVPIEEDWNKRLDIDNLVALCNDCHNFEHLRISPLQKFLKDWENI